MAMRNLVGPGCDVSAGNPLTQLFDAVINDPRQQMGPPKGPMLDPLLGPQGQMLDPAMPFGMDAAWGQAGMPLMGPAMPQQLRAHMQQQPMVDPAFYDMQARGPQWAHEFQNQGMMPGSIAPPAEMWSQEFHAHQQRAMASMPHAAVAAPALAPHPALAAPAPLPNMNAMWMGAQRMPMVPEQAAQEFRQESMQTPEVRDQTADLAQASQMVEMLRTSGNPKFANSAFVKFIDRVSKGDLTFQDNKVIDTTGRELDWDALYDVDVAASSHAEVAELDKLWQQSASSAVGPLDALEAAWKKPGDHFEDMERVWDAAAGDIGQLGLDGLWDQQQMENIWNDEVMGGDLDSAWAAADQFENVWNRGSSTREYNFSSDNPYLDVENPLELAQRLIAEGKDLEAIKALEAEVQKNPESSEGWRQLGQLWAQMDQDVEAIQCLRRGHEVDPYNLDSLLALGVSCTNELDQVEALKYLRSWIENHGDFASLVRGVPEPAFQDIELLRDQVTNLFNAASDLDSSDADVFIALGVIENINRNYGAASMALARACRLRPNDFTCWNKLGATLANSGKSEDALVAYHQALSLKPNYARTWANLAIAHANLGEYADAARFYLSSLTLNPSATHIWTFLHTAMLNSGTFDPSVGERDLEACKRLLPGSLDIDNVPPPMATLAEPADQILSRIGM
eukprot:GEMP01015494.1.p1 GENE.GEMP01015494.1~~GEMP01015494.1.p1  ORF type:complete len:681 (+),score=165.36 GEMP01015494.1:190-2232(+)